MTDLVFVDTNVFLYAMDEGEAGKHRAASEWRHRLWETRRGRTSFQVLQEFYFNATRKSRASSERARDEIQDLLRWQPASISASILQRAWDVEDEYRLSFWDALIVAAAKASSCRYLLTEDLQAGQDFAGVVVVNPFLRNFASLCE